jgi:CHAT domain-containing protein
MQCVEAARLKPKELRALEALLRTVSREVLPTNHTLGVRKAHLATSVSGLYGALLYLQRATSTNSAAAWNDLGAVHLLLYGKRGSIDELISGLESFERALDLGPLREEARFNRALVLQVLGLYPAAVKEWRNLLVVEKRGPWATEIAAYLDSSQQSATSLSSSHERRIRGESLMADWALRSGQGPEAERALKQAVKIGERLAAETGDRLLLDSSRFAEAAQGSLRAALVQAHQRLGAARGSNDYASCADPALKDASKLFVQTGSPYGAWAKVDQAICDFFAKDFATARRRLRSVVHDAPPGYRILRARAAWILGLVELRAGRLPVALSELRKAEAGYSVAGESVYASYLESLIARTLRQMGWRREGWTARGRALKNLSKLDPERRYNVLEEVVEALTEEGRFHAARVFLEAQLAAAQKASRERGARDLPVFAALNSWEIAWTAGDIGRAREALKQAILYLPEVAPGSENWERLRREVALARSWTEGGDAETPLRELLEFYGRHGEGEQLDALKHLQLRVTLDLARGEQRNLRSHLEAALGRAEAIAKWTFDPVQRRSLERRRRWLSARMVELESAKDGLHSLLAVLRSREPVPPAVPDQAAQQALRQIRASLPRGAALLVHFAMEQGTFGWLLDESRLQSWRSPLGSFELGQLANALRSAASGTDQETFRRVAERLGKALLPPMGWGHPGAELFVVADEATAGIAFPTLVDPASGRPLLDDHAVAVQAQVGRLSLGWRDSASIPLTSVAVVAAPALDQVRFPALESLPFARQEGEQIARLYPLSEKRIGVSVSLHMLEAAFRDAPIVHLATHAQGPQEGGEAGLVLGTEGDGILSAADVQELGLRAPIVVLAACRSAVADMEDPGSSSVTQAFLDAGSGSVIASLWPVDDRQSSIMFLRFHQALLEGKNPAQALRVAQLTLRAQLGSKSLETWSAFQVYSGTEGSRPKHEDNTHGR